ncbi:MAG: hypothetical protein FIA94_09880 [Nitrospirae bacterium]|nr:hypothetical protein [Nitrospirota bacterium]
MCATVKNIQDLFGAHPAAFSGIRQSALAARELIEAISRDIEHHTATVCMECTSVCCISRHSRYDKSDVIFLTALGLDVPVYDPESEETSPCRFIGSRGCILKRSLRPYRCTWFFCAPLLDHIMKTTDPSAYRRFMRTLETITEKRTGMIDEFEKLLRKLPGTGLVNM